MKQVIRQLSASRQECYFWATHAGAELDLIVVRGNKRLGFEFKRTSKPSITTSMRIALEDLRLSSLDILYPGDAVFPLAPKIRAVGMTKLATAIKPLK